MPSTLNFFIIGLPLQAFNDDQVAAFVINQKTNAQGRAVRREAYRRLLAG
jgi:hypothetical protein